MLRHPCLPSQADRRAPNGLQGAQMNFSANLTGTVAIRAAIGRMIGLLAVWLAISGTRLSGLAAGIIAATIATLVSLALHRPGARRVRFAPLTRLSLRLLADSVFAGSDVARRALDPRLPLKLGLVRYTMLLPPGPAQATFKMVTCLLPGTLSVGSTPDGTLLVHCLDVAQPVAQGLARNEELLLGALGQTRPDA